MKTECPDCEGKGCAICEHTGMRWPGGDLMSPFWYGFWTGLAKVNLILSPFWIIILIIVIRDIM